MKFWFKGAVLLPLYLVGYALGFVLFLPYLIFLKIPYLLGGGDYELKGYEAVLFPFLKPNDEDYL